MPSIRETPVNTRGKVFNCCLRKIMGEKDNMRIAELCAETNLRRNSVSALYNNTATRIDTITVTAICAALDCTPGDLFFISDASDIRQDENKPLPVGKAAESEG
ncbi:MAG: helix-turn-helix transcriptional regulator [Clostridium sp.]|nr:helix-turn-helix transcriptional regulator [Clostridium sp.]